MMTSQTKKGIRLGIQPTCWTNDDFPEIGDDTPYQVILDETKACGYEGGSTGHNYPKHFWSLREALRSRSLSITSTWVGTQFTAEGQYFATLETVRQQIAFLKSLDAGDLVVAELAAAVNQVRTKAVLTERPEFNQAQWYLLQKGLNEAGQLAAKENMRLSYHPHVGTGVQNREEIDRLMQNTDPSAVWMCLDTGHAYFASVDPLKLARDYIDRIGHIHLKNARREVTSAAVLGNYSFYQAICEGIFTVPGDLDGAIQFAPIFELLLEHNYTGWLVVEAEQDPGKAEAKSPREYAEMAFKFIQEGLKK